MPRGRRFLVDGHAYHVLNRGNRKQVIFHKPGDYRAFLKILLEANARFAMPICGLCVMNNHFHLVLWPDCARSISAYMHWVLNAHVHRYHLHYGIRGTGHLYQDRYKAFPIQDERHLYTVMRYVEANPLRAGLLTNAEHWQWSSLSLRRKPEWQEILRHDDKVVLPEDWLAVVNEGAPTEELKAIRNCAQKGEPFGDPEWIAKLTKNEKGDRLLKGTVPLKHLSP
jgi:putative transposase